MKKYKITDIIEDEFGCEGRPEGEEPMVTILLVDDSDAAVLCRCGIAQSRAAVRRAIVHQDQLKIREGLGKDGSDAGAQKTLCLIYRHDDADLRLFFMLFLHNKLLIASGRFLPSFRPFAA